MNNRSIAPLTHTVEEIQLMPYQNILFDNGVPFYYLHSDETEIFQINFFFRSGYIHQSKKLLADALMALIFNGTLNHSAKQISEMLEQYGVFYTADVYSNYSKIQLTFLIKHIKQVMPVLRDILMYAAFPQEELDIYIKNNIEQYQTQIKNVSTLANWNYSKLIFGDQHPLNKMHTPEDYNNIKRDDLLYFFTSHFHSKNGFIFAAGNVNETSKEYIHHLFGKEAVHQTQNIINTSIPYPNSTEKHIYIHLPDAIQSALKIGMALNVSQKHEDYIDLIIANTVLGGYFGSRLMSVLREEKGYTYGIYSSLTPYENFAVFTISSEIKAEHIQESVNEIIHQIQHLQNTPPDNEELHIVKSYLSGEILESSDGILKQAQLHQNILLKQLNPEYYKLLLQRVKNIQPEEISAVLKKHINVNEIKECIVGRVK